MIVHFDVDSNISPLLLGNKTKHNVQHSFEFNVESITTISIKALSKITAQTLRLFPNLQLIVSRTVGLDHIDLNSCKKKGVAVYNIPDYGSREVAQHALGLLLAGARYIPQASSKVKEGVFDYRPFLGKSLVGKIIGVVGTGKIGCAFIKQVIGLGSSVIAYDLYPNAKTALDFGFRYVKLDELVKKSDAISLHAPLTDESEHLLNDRMMMKMKEGVILVNTARGGLIDTKSLLKYSDKFHAICLDVLEKEENFSKDNPLLKLNNVILTPHIGFYTDRSIEKIAYETKENIRRFKNGEKINRVI